MQQESTHSKPEKKKTPPSFPWRSIFKIAVFGVGAVFLLFLVLSFLLRVPAVQNYVADRVVNHLSTKLQTNVQLDKVRLHFLDVIDLKGFYVEAPSGDTLLYSGQFRVDFDMGWNTLWNRKLEINEISLYQAKLYVTRDSAELKSDLQILIDRLVGQPESYSPHEEPASPFTINIETIQLRQVAFKNNDKLMGSFLDSYLPKGDIKINEFNQEERRFLLEEISLTSPQISVIKRPPSPHLLKDSTQLFFVPNADSTTVTDTLSIPPPFLQIANVQVDQGAFQYQNFVKGTSNARAPDEIDFNFLDVDSIMVDADSLLYKDAAFETRINHISAIEASGFTLENLEAEKLQVTDSEIALKEFVLATPHSSIRNQMTFQFSSFEDFQKFEEKIFLEARFKDARLAIRDLLVFVPELKLNSFFRTNRYETLELNGRVYGRINRLLAKNLYVRLPGRLQMKGSFRTRNLAIKGQEIVNFDLAYLNTRMNVLRQLIPNFNPPENYNKLGQISFSGRFDGFFTDFVAYGNLQTDLGKATMDMNLNSRKGLSNATYSGSLSLTDFDLQTWLDDERFDKITLTSQVLEGEGLSSDNAQANLEAYIKNFSFKGYTYDNVDITGQVNADRFNGKLSINDEHLKFQLEGFVALLQDNPRYNFNASLKEINLQPLKLSDTDYTLSADLDLDLTGNSLSNIKGNAHLKDIDIRRAELHQHIKQIDITSIIRDSTDKTFKLRSELANVTLDGYFDIQHIPKTLAHFVKKQYPAYFDADSLQLKVKKEYDFQISLHVEDSDSITQILDLDMDPVKDFDLQGSFNKKAEALSFEMSVPRLRYGNFELINSLVVSRIKDNYSLLNASGYRESPEHSTLTPFKLHATESNDSISFRVNYGEGEDEDRTLVALGSIISEQDWITMSLSDEKLIIFGEQWHVHDQNRFRFRKDQMDIESFVLRSGNRLVKIRDLHNRGINAQFLNFEAGLIDSVWAYENLDFSGNLKVQLSADDVFEKQNLQAEVSIDSFQINEDDWGFLYMTANLPDMKASGDASLEIIRDQQRIFAKGGFDPAIKGEDQEHTTFKFNVDGTELPFKLLGYFVNGISDLNGKFDADLVIDGNDASPQINGVFELDDAGLTFDYLNTRYYVREEYVPITNKQIDLSGVRLYDELGNTALVMGSLGHTFFADFTVDVLVTSNRFMVMNTTKEDNPDYYGKGIGEMTASFTGDFVNTKIYVNGSALRGSRISIPVTDEVLPNELSFIRFVDNEKEEEEQEMSRETSPSGLEFDMDLTVTEEAEILIIFDERAGDIIRSRGRGDLSLSINTQGDFTMYGEYEVIEGEYLFTLYNIVNKPFILRPGGTINWSGDPYNAQLDIKAEYKGLNASVYNLIAEYLTDEELKQEAREPTPVDLVMILEGQLLQPIINFDIRLPQVEGELQSYTENKLRILRQDQNELNRQVFGLLVIGGFLPSSQGTSTQGKQFISGVNTVSEFITNQLSIYLTGLISEVVRDVGFISGVDFDIAYNVYYHDETLPDESLLQTGGDLQNRIKLYLLDDRLTVNVGQNFNFDLNESYVPIGGSFVGNDLIIEYVVTDDRRLKIRAYQETDRTVEGTRTRFGGGISFRHEFDRLGKKRDNKKEEPVSMPVDTSNLRTEIQ